MREVGAQKAIEQHDAGTRDVRLPIVLVACVVLSVALLGNVSRVALLAAGFATTLLLLPSISRFARRIGAVAVPGGRRLHSGDTPQLGGLAVFGVLLAGLVSTGDPRFMAIALGCTIMASTGAFDDLYGVAPRVKLACQLLAVLPLLSVGMSHDVLHVPPFGAIHLGIWGAPALVLWVVVVTNAFNFIDGADGLASGVCLVMVCAFLPGLGSIGPLLAGTLLGFLRFNLPKADVFLGDAGSLVLGYAAATLPFTTPGGFNVFVVVGVLAYPIGDVALASLRRVVRGKPVYSADSGHLHHLLLRIWKRPAFVLAGLVTMSALSAALVTRWPNARGLILAFAAWACFGAYVLRHAGVRIDLMLVPRRAFRQVHALRRYANCSLQLAQTPADVLRVLARIAQDLQLCSLEARGLAVTGPRRGNVEIERESTEHGAWSYLRNGYDRAFLEERHNVLQDLTRQASTTLCGFEQTGTAAPIAAIIADLIHGASEDCAGRVYIVVSHAEELVSGARLANNLEAHGLRPMLVSTGTRDSLLPPGLKVPREPDIDLDVDRGAEANAFAEQRFEDLLGVMPAACVLVAGGSKRGMACAHAAARLDVPVAHLDGTRMLFWNAGSTTGDEEVRCSVAVGAVGRN